MLKANNKVICIDNKSVEDQLTVNKTYFLSTDEREKDNCFSITYNDNCMTGVYYKERFKPLENYKPTDISESISKLTTLGYKITPPPEKLKGKVAIVKYTNGKILPYLINNEGDLTYIVHKDSNTLLALVDWEEK